MIFLCLIGVLLAGIALGVFLTQGSQIRVRANVLSERCQPKLTWPAARGKPAATHRCNSRP